MAVPPPKPGPPINAASTDDVLPAVQGTSMEPVTAFSQGLGGGVGVIGASGSGIGVQASAYSGIGLQATSYSGNAIYATQSGDAQSLPDLILAETSSDNHAAIAGHNNGGGSGVWAFSQSGTAVVATNDAPGTADADALVAYTSSPNHAALAAHNNSAGGASVPSGFGVWASSNNTAIYGAGAPAGYFEGDVVVTGDVVLSNVAYGDIAEEFDLADGVTGAEPGTVMIITESGRLGPSGAPYDTRVAGVVSGAGDLDPAIVLQRDRSRSDRSQIALLGKTFCKVDASGSPIAVGDLLTTSATPGHAMKAADRSQAMGAILGKALVGQPDGRGLIPILVSLR
jgi:hypothetical protein